LKVENYLFKVKAEEGCGAKMEDEWVDLILTNAGAERKTED
jgi:hypothetical protein